MSPSTTLIRLDEVVALVAYSLDQEDMVRVRDWLELALSVNDEEPADA